MSPDRAPCKPAQTGAHQGGIGSHVCVHHIGIALPLVGPVRGADEGPRHDCRLLCSAGRAADPDQPSITRQEAIPSWAARNGSVIWSNRLRTGRTEVRTAARTTIGVCTGLLRGVGWRADRLAASGPPGAGCCAMQQRSDGRLPPSPCANCSPCSPGGCLLLTLMWETLLPTSGVGDWRWGGPRGAAALTRSNRRRRRRLPKPAAGPPSAPPCGHRSPSTSVTGTRLSAQHRSGPPPAVWGVVCVVWESGQLLTHQIPARPCSRPDSRRHTFDFFTA